MTRQEIRFDVPTVRWSGLRTKRRACLLAMQFPSIQSEHWTSKMTMAPQFSQMISKTPSCVSIQDRGNSQERCENVSDQSA